MMDYSQIVIDMKKALIKYQELQNKRNYRDAKTESLKILSSAKLLHKITENEPEKV